MLRIGLSVYLMFATLAGPWFCCCQLPRLGARFLALLRNEKATPTESAPSCCQHRVPVNDSRQPAKPSNPPGCPCQGKRQEAPALVLLESESARQLDRDANTQVGDLLDSNSLSGIDLPSLTRMLTSSPLSAAVLTGRDILSSLHILRC